MNVPIKRGTARRLGLRPWWPHFLAADDVKPLSEEDLAEFKREFADAVRTPVGSTVPCSPEWEPSAVFPVGVFGALHSWRCACGAGPTLGGVFADPRNARSDFVAHVMRGIEAKS